MSKNTTSVYSEQIEVLCRLVLIILLVPGCATITWKQTIDEHEQKRFQDSLSAYHESRTFPWFYNQFIGKTDIDGVNYYHFIIIDAFDYKGFGLNVDSDEQTSFDIYIPYNEPGRPAIVKKVLSRKTTAKGIYVEYSNSKKGTQRRFNQKEAYFH